MADPILISPDKRLLGWALTDLTLYGGQPVPEVVIGRAADAAGNPAPATTPPESVATAAHEGDLAAHDTAALLDDAATQPTAHPAAISPVALVQPTPASHDVEAPSLPQPVGSGSFIQAPIAAPGQAVEADHAADQAAPATPVDAATALAPAPSIAADAVPPTQMIIADTPAAVVDIVAAPLAAALTDTTAPVVAELAHTVDTVAHEAVALPETITETLSSLTGAHDAVVDTAPLEGFAGTDPVGGVMTLVGMVEQADAFHLDDAITPVAADIAPASILDALAADDLPPVLLGDGHGLLDHHGDDGGIHVGL